MNKTNLILILIIILLSLAILGVMYYKHQNAQPNKIRYWEANDKMEQIVSNTIIYDREEFTWTKS